MQVSEPSADLLKGSAIPKEACKRLRWWNRWNTEKIRKLLWPAVKLFHTVKLGMVPLHPFALIFSVALSVALHWSSFFFLLRSKVVEDLLQTGPRPIWLSKSFECFGFETATKRLRGKQVEYHCNISCIILPLSHLKSILTCDVRRCTRSNPWTPVTVYVF